MEALSRKAAIAAGLAHYFTGRPCKRGHIAARRVSTRTCVECGRLLTAQWARDNPERSRELRRAAYMKDVERQRARSLAWHHANRERSTARMTARQRAMPDAYKLAFKLWAADNGARIRSLSMKRHAAKLKRTPLWADLSAIHAFYAACPANLQVDHIIPLQGRLVSGLHVLNNLQYLDKKANISKNNKFDPWTFEP